MSDGMNSKTMGIGSYIETGRITEGGSSNHLNGGTERSGKICLTKIEGTVRPQGQS